MKEEIGKQERNSKDSNLLPPPNNKHKCETCGLYYKHIEKDKEGNPICRKCKRWKPTNKWFVPKDQRINNFIGNKSINDTERLILKKQFIQQGYSPESAEKKLNFHIRLLKNSKIQRRSKTPELSNKSFLEGLGQIK